MLGDLREEGVEFYADDVILRSETIDEHIILLKNVLDRKREYGATTAIKKCFLFEK